MATDEQGRLLTIARCTKCGRGFVSMPDKGRMTDGYPAMGSPKDNKKPCGGVIEMLPQPILSDR